MFEEGKPDHPARLRGRPSSSEEGKTQLQDLPSFLKEGWRPKAAGVVIVVDTTSVVVDITSSPTST